LLQVWEKLEEEESLTWFCLPGRNHGRVHVICWLEISRRGGAGSTAVGGDAVKPHAFLRPSRARARPNHVGRPIQNRRTDGGSVRRRRVVRSFNICCKSCVINVQKSRLQL
jgi:hypothetical protein